MAILLLVPLLAMAACTGAVPVPVGMECGLHRHVEDLHTIRSTGSCNLPYNGQNLSPATCGAGSLESYVAAKPGEGRVRCVVVLSSAREEGREE